MSRLHHLVVASALLASALCASAQTAPASPSKTRDAGLTMPKTAPNSATDKSGRCESKSVNECRTACDSKRFDTTDKNRLPKLQYECKQDCIRGC